MRNYLLAILLFNLHGCGTIGGNPDSKKPSAITGTVTISITDAPVSNAKNVYITVNSIEVVPEDDGDAINIPLVTETEIDLLDLHSGKTLDLANLTELPVGTYQETRLILSIEKSARLIDSDGSEHVLQIPSGSESGLKIKSSFSVVEGEDTKLTLDFDLRKSIHRAGGKSKNQKYILKPSLRLLRNDETGIVSGKSSSGETVCIYGENATKDTTDSCENAESSARVVSGKYKMAFVPDGNYSARIFASDGTYSDITEIRVKAGESTVAESE